MNSSDEYWTAGSAEYFGEQKFALVEAGVTVLLFFDDRVWKQKSPFWQFGRLWHLFIRRASCLGEILTRLSISAKFLASMKNFVKKIFENF